MRSTRPIERHRAWTLWAPLTNAALGLWLITSPFMLGLFDPVTAPVPPALGHEIALARNPQRLAGHQRDRLRAC